MTKFGNMVRDDKTTAELIADIEALITAIELLDLSYFYEEFRRATHHCDSGSALRSYLCDRYEELETKESEILEQNGDTDVLPELWERKKAINRLLKIKRHGEPHKV